MFCVYQWAGAGSDPTLVVVVLVRRPRFLYIMLILFVLLFSPYRFATPSLLKGCKRTGIKTRCVFH